MFSFYTNYHEPFGSLIKNGLLLDKNKSIVATFSVFLVCKLAVSPILKNGDVECFSLVSDSLFLPIFSLVFQENR